jgi:3-oxoacyl-[acyl-carrier protein] reductase
MFHWHLNANVLGTVLTNQEAVKSFAGQGGVIINVGSVVIHNAAAEGSIYAASKSAIASLTSTLSRELAPKKSALSWLTLVPLKSKAFIIQV